MEAARAIFTPDSHLYEEVFGDLKNELYRVCAGVKA